MSSDSVGDRSETHDSDNIPQINSGSTSLRLPWFALNVAVRHEKIVSQILGNKGYETYLPTYKRRHQYAKRVREFEIPLFPGYIFCRLDPGARLPILTTPGVLRIVGAGRVPIAVEDSEIAPLQKATAAGVPMAPSRSWPTGHSCRITAGPLAGVQGIVVAAKHGSRLIVSVHLLQRSISLEVDSDCIAAE